MQRRTPRNLTVVPASKNVKKSAAVGLQVCVSVTLLMSLSPPGMEGLWGLPGSVLSWIPPCLCPAIPLPGRPFPVLLAPVRLGSFHPSLKVKFLQYHDWSLPELWEGHLALSPLATRTLIIAPICGIILPCFMSILSLDPSACRPHTKFRAISDLKYFFCSLIQKISSTNSRAHSVSIRWVYGSEPNSPKCLR